MIDLLKDYILSNIYWLLPIFVSVVECFIIVIFKKKPVYNFRDEVWNEIYSMLPSWIIAAEEKFDNGMSKLSYVLDCAVSFHPELFHEKANFILLRKAIEEILDCPQRKGFVIRKEENDG